MNDDFLHRLREAPRPEFLAALKSRLDRQPRASRRPGFVVGVLVGLLAAGAAFALYLNEFRHPADVAGADHIKATPLAPAWLPTHPHPYSGPPPVTASAELIASGASAASAERPPAAGAPTFQ